MRRGEVGAAVVVQDHVAGVAVHQSHGHVWCGLSGSHPNHTHFCDTRHCIHYKEATGRLTQAEKATCLSDVWRGRFRVGSGCEGQVHATPKEFDE